MSGYGSPYQPPKRTGRTALIVLGVTVGLFLLCCCGGSIALWQGLV